MEFIRYGTDLYDYNPEKEEEDNMLIITIIASILLIAIPFFMHHVAFSKSAEQGLSIRSQIKETIKYWRQRPVRLTVVIILSFLLLIVIIVTSILELGTDNSTIRFYTVDRGNSITVTITNGLGISEIYYTADGTDPDNSSTAIKYENPFTVQNSCTIIATRKWLGMSLCQNSVSYNIDNNGSIAQHLDSTNTTIPVTEPSDPATNTFSLVTVIPVPGTDAPVPATDTPNPYEVSGRNDCAIVPDVIHMPFLEAFSLLDRLGYTVRFHTDSNKDPFQMYVYDQSTPADIVLPKGQPIDLKLLPIAYDENTNVPSVVGMSYQEAKTVLGDCGLTVTESYHDPDELYDGYILAQSVPANSTVPAATNVHLCLQKSKPSEKEIAQAEENTIIVPDIINMEFAEAEKLLKGKGLIAKINLFSEREHAHLYVAWQSVPAGTIVPTKTAIEIELFPVRISNESVTVPDVVNVEVFEAQKQLANYGLRSVYSLVVEEHNQEISPAYVKYQGIPEGSVVPGGTVIPLELTVIKP